MQNGHITLKDVRVPEANRLQGGNSFRDTAKVLKMTRYAVAWMATGCAMARVPDLIRFCKTHGLVMVTVADLARYRLESEFDGWLWAIDGSSLWV